VFQQMVALDTEATNAKSCEMARQLPALLAEAGPALEAGRAIAEGFTAPRIQAIPTYTTRFEQMIRAYCR
jgi:hypothetical protein